MQPIYLEKLQQVPARLNFKRMKKYLFPIVYGVILLSGCEKQDDLYSTQNPIGPQIGDIISFQTVSTSQTDADGVSLCTVKVKIHPEADAANRAVIFKVTGSARFTNGYSIDTINANTQGYAIASFYNTKAEAVQLKASVLTYIIDTTVSFIKALPDDMQLTADDYVLDTGQAVHLTSTLYRNAGRGKATDGAKVFFTITPLDTVINFIYLPFSFSQNQIAADTAINPFRVGGRFRVDSKTVSALGDTLRKSINLIVK
jgi:hypothetical protein